MPGESMSVTFLMVRLGSVGGYQLRPVNFVAVAHCKQLDRVKCMLAGGVLHLNLACAAFGHPVWRVKLAKPVKHRRSNGQG